MSRPAVDQLLNLATEAFFVLAELERSFEVQNGSRTSLPDFNVHVSPLRRAKLTELGFAIKARYEFAPRSSLTPPRWIC